MPGGAGQAPGGSGFAAELGALAENPAASAAPSNVQADTPVPPKDAASGAGQFSTAPEVNADNGPESGKIAPGIEVKLDTPQVDGNLGAPAGEAVADPLPGDDEAFAGLPVQAERDTEDGAEAAVVDLLQGPQAEAAAVQGGVPLPPQGNELPVAEDEAAKQAADGVGHGARDKAAPVLPGVTPAEPDAKAGLAGQLPPAGAEGGAAEGAAQTAAGAAVTQPAVPAERRWQSELPKELRAPSVTLQQTAAAVQSKPENAATLPDGQSGDVAADIDPDAALKPSAPKTAQDLPEGAVKAVPEGQEVKPVLPGAAGMTAVEETGDLPAGTAEGGDENADGSAQDRRPVATAEAGPAVKPAVNGRGQSVDAPAARAGAADASGLQPPEDADLVTDPVSGDDVETGKVSADPKSPASGDGKAGLGGSRPAAADAGTRPEARLADRAAAGLPAAAAAQAASLMSGDDAGLATDPADLSLTGDAATATVRGGEMTGAVRSESLQAPNQSQSAHVAHQVAAEIARNLKNGQTRFHMRFDPPELGRVEVNMKVASDGTVHAHLIVDRPETLDMFLRDQRGLERALEAAGLNPDSDNLQFSLKQDGGGEFTSGGDQQGQGFGGGTEPADGAGSEADPMVEEIVRMRLAEQRGGLDMKV